MKFKWLVSVGLALTAAMLLAGCAALRPTVDDASDPAIAAIYADADAKAAQKRAQQLRLVATQAAQATATAAYAPFAAQTAEARVIEAARLSELATQAPIATAQAAVAQAATMAPVATATASAAQTASAAPLATKQVQQVLAAQTAVVAPTATWQAFQLEVARRDALAQTEQQNAAVSRLLDLAWIGALVVLIAAGVILVGRQMSKTLTQTTLARATAATTVEQARAVAERARQRAEEAKARAAHARPPVYVIEEQGSPSERATPNAPARIDAHGDDDIQLVWETQLREPVDALAQTGTLIIDSEAHGQNR